MKANGRDLRDADGLIELAGADLLRGRVLDLAELHVPRRRRILRHGSTIPQGETLEDPDPEKKR